MPRRKVMRRRVKGYGFFGDLWSGIKKGVSTVSDVVGSALPIIKPAASVAKMFVPGAAPILGAVGLGRRRRRGGAMAVQKVPVMIMAAPKPAAGGRRRRTRRRRVGGNYSTMRASNLNF